MTAGGKLENVPSDPLVLQEIEKSLTNRLLSEFPKEVIIPKKLIPS
jgi:hypothetical protein